MSTADDWNQPSSSSMDTPSDSAAPTLTGSSSAASNVSDDTNDDKYKYLVLDSGPIIRLTGMSSLRNRAKSYLTVPAVLEEIRDAHARQHLSQLPFDLVTREPTPKGIQAMVDFARQTGDYASLSSVDLQVLGLLYDLEFEANNGNMDHVRTQPKKTLGVGRIESLQPKQTDATNVDSMDDSNPQESSEDGAAAKENSAYFQSPPAIPLVTNDATTTDADGSTTSAEQQSVTTKKITPKTWAMMVNPSAASMQDPTPSEDQERKVSDAVLNANFGSMNIGSSRSDSISPQKGVDSFVEGQFSDAEEDISIYSDDDGYADSDKEVSDEECEVYILDPEQLDEGRDPEHTTELSAYLVQSTEASVEKELVSDFPSLTAAMHVPYEGSDEDEDEQDKKTPAIVAKEEAEKRKAKALEPRTNSGKLYNSFRKYGDVVKPKGRPKKRAEEDAYYTSGVETVTPDITTDDDENVTAKSSSQSRIIGGMSFAGQTSQVHDDGEGWITSASEIRKMKSDGNLDPSSRTHSSNASSKQPQGPPMCQRAACATTDFAMQNVLLQMNLELLSVDGIKVRKLKSWVMRCGACFTVYADSKDSNTNMKRLFCARCGSDMMQRIAASVDSKSGRLRLHLSKKYKHNLRGTKYSLPKPGSNNRFQGDLLLREDQLLTGAWNQKVKKRSGGKARSAAQSMFGSDLATNVGCHADVFKRDDIKVGFGRRNPNAAKGRERRGKKKKSSDKACGLRRY